MGRIKIIYSGLKTDEVVWSGINYDEKVFLDYGVLIDSNLVFEVCEYYYEDDLEKNYWNFKIIMMSIRRILWCLL